MIKKIGVLCCSIFFSVSSFAEGYGHYYGEPEYEVTVVNITKGQSFTPILGATHSNSVHFFELGDVASSELEMLAEGGAIAPLRDVLESSNLVKGTGASEGLLMPGNAVTFTLKGAYYGRLSLAAMLLPTNDTFVALDSVRLPRRGTKTYYAKAYDAGTETNSELCADIPGPHCGGAAISDEGGEGYVYMSAGIHGEADLSASSYDWRGAVAKVMVRRVK